MKLFRTVSLLALMLILTGASLARPQQPNQSGGQPAENGDQPQLVIESTTHDFGELKSGTPLRYAFKIKNTGKADLLIKSVTPS